MTDLPLTFLAPIWDSSKKQYDGRIARLILHGRARHFILTNRQLSRPGAFRTALLAQGLPTLTLRGQKLSVIVMNLSEHLHPLTPETSVPRHEAQDHCNRLNQSSNPS